MSTVPLFERGLDVAVREARQIVTDAQDEYGPVATCALFSGGKDSSVLLDVAADMADYAVFIDTGIGLEVTRRFVAEECRRRGMPLITEQPDLSFEAMVTEVLGGFPGPSMHRIAYQRLKERALRKVRRRFVTARGQRVLFLTGIRMSESGRRFARGADQAVDREGSVVWANPLLTWSNDEMATYRRERGLAVSPAYEHIHMSGECLCGAFGTPEELDEIEFFDPDDPAVRRIRALEERCRAEGLSPCQWGPDRTRELRVDRPTGRLCSSCDARLPGMEEIA